VVSPICAFVSGQILSRTGHARRTARTGAVLQIVGLAMLLYVPPVVAELWVLLTSIHEAELVQLAAGGLVLFAAWFMADLPLGTARHAGDVEIQAKGHAWNPVAADR